MDMGILSEKMGAKVRALGYFNRAASIFRRTGHRYNYAAAVFNKAFVQYGLGRLEVALRNCEEALDLEGDKGSPMLAGHAILQMANIYDAQGAREISWNLYRRARDAYRRAGERVKEADICHRLGAIALLEKNPPDALRFLESSLKLRQELDFAHALAKYYFARGRVYRELGQNFMAINFFRQALGLFKGIGSEKDVKKTLFQIYRLLNEKGERVPSLPEFLKLGEPQNEESDHMAPMQDEVYCLRRQDGYKTPAYREHPQRGRPVVDRALLGSLLRDLGRAYGMQGEGEKAESLGLQAKAVFTYTERSIPPSK